MQLRASRRSGKVSAGGCTQRTIAVMAVTAPCDLRDTYTCAQPWPDDCRVQAGTKGLVCWGSGGSGGSYRTAFFEAFPTDPRTFIRGEGADVAAAEAAAWAKYQRITTCNSHQIERAGYRNGSGVCSSCGMFVSKAFEPITASADERARVEALVGPTEGISGRELRQRVERLHPSQRTEAEQLADAIAEIAGELDLTRLADGRPRVEALVGPTEGISGWELRQRVESLHPSQRAEAEQLADAIAEIARELDLARLRLWLGLAPPSAGGVQPAG